MRKIFKIFIDFDGTIAGESKWSGFWYNTSQLFKTGLLMELPSYNWSVLTSRPKMDKFFIWKACRKYKIYPDKIITTNTWFYPFKDKEDASNWKSSILSKCISDQIFIDKVIYVDSDSEITSKIFKQPNLIICHPNVLKNVLNYLEGDIDGEM